MMKGLEVSLLYQFLPRRLVRFSLTIFDLTQFEAHDLLDFGSPNQLPLGC
jgi:hypothetical protein